MLVTVSGADPAVDITSARSALQRAAGRFSDLLGSAPDPEAPIPGSEWDVAEMAAHVVLISEAYAAFARGRTEPLVDVSDVPGGSLARTSAARLAAEPQRELAALRTRLIDGGRSLLEATEGRAGTDLVSWNGQEIGIGEMLGIAVGEYLLHGLDLASALSQPWTIEPDDARLVLAAVLPLLPLLVDRRVTADVTAAYDIRIRGGRRVSLRISRGEATVGSNGGPVDCHVSADPVAMLLVAYGRRSQWGPALTGKLVAWGRKPWLGLRLTHYLVAP
jgi:uncharacterized protein (TIGR03083 family)